MAEDFWLINPHRSRVKRFSKNKQNKDKLFEYMLIGSRRIIVFFGKEPNLMASRKGLNVYNDKDVWVKLTAQGWRRTKPV